MVDYQIPKSTTKIIPIGGTIMMGKAPGKLYNEDSAPIVEEDDLIPMYGLREVALATLLMDCPPPHLSIELISNEEQPENEELEVVRKYMGIATNNFMAKRQELMLRITQDTKKIIFKMKTHEKDSDDYVSVQDELKILHLELAQEIANLYPEGRRIDPEKFLAEQDELLLEDQLEQIDTIEYEITTDHAKITKAILDVIQDNKNPVILSGTHGMEFYPSLIVQFLKSAGMLDTQNVVFASSMTDFEQTPEHVAHMVEAAKLVSKEAHPGAYVLVATGELGKDPDAKVLVYRAKNLQKITDKGHKAFVGRDDQRREIAKSEVERDATDGNVAEVSMDKSTGKFAVYKEGAGIQSERGKPKRQLKPEEREKILAKYASPSEHIVPPLLDGNSAEAIIAYMNANKSNHVVIEGGLSAFDEANITLKTLFIKMVHERAQIGLSTTMVNAYTPDKDETRLEPLVPEKIWTQSPFLAEVKKYGGIVTGRRTTIECFDRAVIRSGIQGQMHSFDDLREAFHPYYDDHTFYALDEYPDGLKELPEKLQSTENFDYSNVDLKDAEKIPKQQIISVALVPLKDLMTKALDAMTKITDTVVIEGLAGGTLPPFMIKYLKDTINNALTAQTEATEKSSEDKQKKPSIPKFVIGHRCSADMPPFQDRWKRATLVPIQFPEPPKPGDFLDSTKSIKSLEKAIEKIDKGETAGFTRAQKNHLNTYREKLLEYKQSLLYDSLADMIVTHGGVIPAGLKLSQKQDEELPEEPSSREQTNPIFTGETVFLLEGAEKFATQRNDAYYLSGTCDSHYEAIGEIIGDNEAEPSKLNLEDSLNEICNQNYILLAETERMQKKSVPFNDNLESFIRNISRASAPPETKDIIITGRKTAEIPPGHASFMQKMETLGISFKVEIINSEQGTEIVEDPQYASRRGPYVANRLFGELLEKILERDKGIEEGKEGQPLGDVIAMELDKSLREYVREIQKSWVARAKIDSAGKNHAPSFGDGI